MLKSYINNRLIYIMLLALFMAVPRVVPAVTLDAQTKIDGQTVYLNGQGPRKKAFLTVYDVGLYLTEKGSDAHAIIDADHPMALALVIRSVFVTAGRISDAFREGLDKSTGGNIEPIEAQARAFLEVFKEGVSKNDRYRFEYIPEKGTSIYKNGELKTVIEGLDFKRALFGIWLSDSPVTETLKKQLLGTQ